MDGTRNTSPCPKGGKVGIMYSIHFKTSWTLVFKLTKVKGSHVWNQIYVDEICNWFLREHMHKARGFPGGSDGKASAYNTGDPGSIPGLGRSPGEGNGNPLQFSCLDNSRDRGAWQAIVHGVTKSQTRLSDQHTQVQGWVPAGNEPFVKCRRQIPSLSPWWYGDPWGHSEVTALYVCVPSSTIHLTPWLQSSI